MTTTVDSSNGSTANHWFGSWSTIDQPNDSQVSTIIMVHQVSIIHSGWPLSNLTIIDEYYGYGHGPLYHYWETPIHPPYYWLTIAMIWKWPLINQVMDHFQPSLSHFWYQDMLNRCSGSAVPCFAAEHHTNHSLPGSYAQRSCRCGGLMMTPWMVMNGCT